MVALLAALAGPSWALNETGVLVLYNSASPEGVQIANYYAQVHPGVQVLGLTGVSTAEEITADDYLATIRPQVMDYLNAPGAPDVDCIVTTKGLPVRINNTHSNPGTYPGWRGSLFGVQISNDWWEQYSSLESELTRVRDVSSWQEMGDQAHFMGPPDPFWGQIFSTYHQAANPYYDSGAAFDASAYEDMILTSRLDGFTSDDVIASIDRAQNAFLGGVVVDDDPNAVATAVDRMSELVGVLTTSGETAVYDTTDTAITDAVATGVMGYVSHGTNDGTGGLETDYVEQQLDFDLTDGAIFHTYESFNAYSFTEGGNQGGQALIAEWLAVGGTLGVGNVEEPTAAANTLFREDIFFDMLLQGYTWAEAAWSSHAQLSFVNTVVGDPLAVFVRHLGDLNGDGLIDEQDVNELCDNFSGGAPLGDPIYDMDGDGDADVDDVVFLIENYVQWSRQAGPDLLSGYGTRVSDFNRDGVVDTLDLRTLALAFGSSEACWACGDANFDGNTNSTDLMVLKGDFGYQAGAPVPEPTVLTLLSLNGIILLRRRRAFRRTNGARLSGRR